VLGPTPTSIPSPTTTPTPISIKNICNIIIKFILYYLNLGGINVF